MAQQGEDVRVVLWDDESGELLAEEFTAPREMVEQVREFFRAFVQEHEDMMQERREPQQPQHPQQPLEVEEEEEEVVEVVGGRTAKNKGGQEPEHG